MHARTPRRWSPLVAALSLAAACGGAEGGGTSVRGGGGATFVHLDPPAVRLVGAPGGVLAEPRQVTVTFDGDGLAWGTSREEPAGLPGWLELRHGAIFDGEDGAHGMTFSVGVAPTPLAPGTYSFILRFLTGRGDLEAPRDASHADLAITYEVRGAP